MEPAPARAAARMTRPLVVARWISTAAVAFALAATVASSQLRGSAARRNGAPAAGAPHSVSVSDAADAFRMWRSAGVRGQRLLLLTGRWTSVPLQSVPSSVLRHLAGTSELPARGSPFLTVDTATLAIALSGIARRMDVVMPPAQFQQRLGAVRGHKDLEAGDDSFALHFNGFERRFFAFPDGPQWIEPVIVLVEPSFFAAGDADVAGWLAARHLPASQIAVALADPVATDPQREKAKALAAGAAAAEWRPRP